MTDVHPCGGGSPLARLAGRVAEELAELEEPGKVVAVDGCAGACSSRRLAAKGIVPDAVVTLTELGADPSGRGSAHRLAQAAAVAARRGTPVRRRRPQRPAIPAVAPGRAHSADDYLLALDRLTTPVVECGALAVESPTLAAHVSQLLGVSRPSAGEMIDHLAARGLVERGARKELLLTRRGRAAADRAIRRHRLLELLACDVLGYKPAEAYERARLLADGFDDDALARLERTLGEPERCPHGWPVDAKRAREESAELVTLASLPAGTEATVVGVVEHDGPLLGRLADAGIVPGARVESGALAGEDASAVFVRASASARRTRRRPS